MRKNKFFLIFVIMITLVSISFSSCKNTTNYIKENVDVNILSFCNASEEDFNKYNSAFSGENVEFAFEDYRLLKVTYKISNKNDFSIRVFNNQVIKNKDFYLVENCIDLEPTYAISPNSSLDVDVYVYINKDLTNENDILNKLNELDIDFSYVT